MLKYQIHRDRWDKLMELLKSANFPIESLKTIKFGTSLLVDVPEELFEKMSEIVTPMCNR